MLKFLKTISPLNDKIRVCDIEHSFEMIQSRISRHLKILKEAGFLKVERKSRWAYYSIRKPLDIFRQNILEEISYLEFKIPQMVHNCKTLSQLNESGN